MVRPIVLIFQEFDEVTATPSTPDLNCLITGPAYQIQDYPDDSDDIQVSNYGTLNEDNPASPPTGGTAAITLAAPPNITTGAWVDPASVRVYFDSARVILEDGTDGVTTTTPPDENTLSSTSATFVTNGVAAGDTLIVADPAGGGSDLVLTVQSVDSETQLRVTTNFTAADTGLSYRVEREVNDEEIDDSFVSTPTFRDSNEIEILGGVTIPVDSVARTVTFANVYISYRAYRTDLQNVDRVDTTTDIQTKVGRIDARNPLASALSIAKQNAGRAPIQFYGVETQDLTGYTKVKDAISTDDSIYAIVPLHVSLSTLSMFKTDNETLADPNSALANGIPQKFRTVIGSTELTEEETQTAETNTGTTEFLAGATPPGTKTIDIASLTALTTNLQPGDQLIVSASENVSSLDGTYTIAHINSETELETDEEFPTTVGSAEGINYRVYRASTNTDVVSLVDNRGFFTSTEDVTYTAIDAGVTPAANTTVEHVQDASTADGIESIVETVGSPNTIVINADFTSGNVTAQDIVDALNDGTGVTQSFSGSTLCVASTSSGSTVQTTFTATSLNDTQAGVDDLQSVSALDDVFIRLFDSAASFISDGVQVGDLIEIPENPNGTYGSDILQFTVGDVLSEQRLEIDNISSGSYVNNTSTKQNELPHTDNRLGTGTTVSQGSIRYRVVRELTTDQQVTQLVSEAQSLDSRRAVLVWPDKVDVSDLVDNSKDPQSDGSAALADSQPGYYLAAAVGGMTAGLPSHQGFSRIGIAGIDKIYNASNYFTESQLTEISDGGLYVFKQDTSTSLPYSIHQLTTDPSTLESGEYSVVKNFDFVSLFFLDLLEPFLGQWNINNDTLGFIRQAINTGIENLKLRRVAKIGAPLNSASITSIEVSDSSADRVEVFVEVDLPKPLNVIGAHLVG